FWTSTITRPRVTVRITSRERSLPAGRSADPDQLLVDELVRAVLPELAPPAGPLDAAEWELGTVGADDVDVHHAGFDLVGHAVGLLGIGREEVGAEPEGRVVRQLDRLLLRPDAVHHRDRPEELLAIGIVAGRDVGQHHGR